VQNEQTGPWLLLVGNRTDHSIQTADGTFQLKAGRRRRVDRDGFEKVLDKAIRTVQF
jgi:hypothetical protein